MKVLEKFKRILASATISLLVVGFLPTGVMADQPELPQIVINEIQTAGSAGARDEFVELYNSSNREFNLDELELQYKKSINGNFSSMVRFDEEDVIPAKGFYLIGGKDYSGVYADRSENFGSGLAAEAHIALVDEDGARLDLVGWGNVDEPDGEAAPSPAAGQSIERTNGIDTNNNAADFTVRITPTPTNSLGVTVDTAAPTLEEITPIITPTNNLNPSYVFSSTEAGTISYVGACGAGDLVDVVNGLNTVKFTLTDDGIYSDCALKVKDSQNNESTLNVTSFIVDTDAPDKAANLYPNNYLNDTQFTNFYWDTVTDENGPVEYRIQYALELENNEPVNPTVTNWSTLNEASRVSFSEGAVVWWQVQTRDKVGNSLGWSDSAWFTIDNTPPTLKDFTNTRTNETVTVESEADDNLTPNDLTYIWHSDNPAVQFGTPKSSSTTISASADGEYQVSLAVSDLAGNTRSKDFYFEWDTTANPVTELVGMAGENLVDLLWTNPADADLASIEIYRSATEGELGDLQATLVTGQTAYTDNTVLPGVTYYYTVITKDTLENESVGELISLTTKITDTDKEEVQAPIVTGPLQTSNTGGQNRAVAGSTKESVKKEVKAATKEEVKAESKDNKDDKNTPLPAWGIALLALVGLLGLYLLWNQYPEMFGWLLFWKKKKKNNSNKLK